MKMTKQATALLALLLSFACLLCACGEATPSTDATKTITVQVVNGEDTQSFTIESDAEYLRGALESINLIAGTESEEYGLFVTTVNGVEADSTQEQWWCFTKGGEMLDTGVDTTPIADGDAFEITLTTGYDVY